jgi:hypothetical protein
MAPLTSPLDPLIKAFDCIGWVPTIRGSLSFNFLDDNDISNDLWGDVDKFFVGFKHYYEHFNSARYLVASSLLAFKDSKEGEDYCKVFRFIFRGTVRDKVRQEKFIEKLGNKKEIKDLFKKNELLVGKLSIVVHPSKKLTEDEIKFLTSLKDLSKKKKKYVKSYYQEAASCDKLQEQREELKQGWEAVEANIKAIEEKTEQGKPEENKGNRIYKFDVVLSRDGVLFLKDDTDTKFRSDYFKEGTASDFTQNTPIHRVFKTGMHFIKFLFHENYHHKKENDTLLPATNLHPIKHNKGNISKIVKHQIDALLVPIIGVKRTSFSNFMCDPIGLTLYAQSYVHIFEKQKLIQKEEADALRQFIDLQQEEFKQFSAKNSIIIEFFLTQKNKLAVIAMGLVFLLAAIDISGFFGVKPLCINQLSSLDEILPHILVICVGFVGVGIHQWIVKRNLAKTFNRKKARSRSILHKDSNVNSKKFSLRYRFYLRWIEVKLRILKWREKEDKATDDDDVEEATIVKKMLNAVKRVASDIIVIFGLIAIMLVVVATAYLLLLWLY